MKVAILANDHAGLFLKEEATRYLEERGYQVRNIGVDKDDSVDYPDVFAEASVVALKEKESIGLFICGTGVGACVTANKIRGLHCALVHDSFTAKMAREHNHCRVIAVGARVVDSSGLIEILKAFLEAEPASGRHLRRVEKIYNLETQQYDAFVRSVGKG